MKIAHGLGLALLGACLATACAARPEATAAATSGTAAAATPGAAAVAAPGASVAPARPPVDSVLAALHGYARTAFAGYAEAVDSLDALQAAVDTLLAHPSPATLAGARSAWIASRDPYSRTEAFRFAGGPIDDLDPARGREGPEGRINSWPIDEAYLDYVRGAPGSGLVGDRSVPIDEASLVSRNARDDDTQVTLGYHAIEFLLWGQDLRPDGPGARPYTDYLPGDPVRDRRRACLRLIVDLLVRDLRTVRDAWDPAQGGERHAFLAAEPAGNLGRALSGPATLAAFELGSERIGIPLSSGEQEDEESCFSDNTHRDIAADIEGMARVLEGDGGAPGLLIALDRKHATEIRERLGRLRKLAARIPAPFDAVLLSPKEDPRRRVLEALLGELLGLAGAIQRGGTAVGARVVIGGG